MKNFFISLIVMIQFQTTTFSQTSFHKNLGLNETDDVYGVLQTPDGGYIIASNYTPVLKARKVRLVKTDANGNEQWVKLVGDVYANNCRSIQPCRDGGYIIGGYLETITNTGFLLIKVDASGNQQWFKMQHLKDEKAYGYFAVQTSDGGYVICGSTSGNGQNVYLVKTDASGNLEWEKTYGGANEDCAYSVCQTNDGGYIIGGRTKSFGDTDGDAYLLKISANGTEEWKQTFDGPKTYNDYIHCVRQTVDGGYIATGNTSNRISDLFLLKTDGKGNKQWWKFYGTNDYDDGRWLSMTKDGGYIVGGFVHAGRQNLSDRDMYLIKTDGSGNEQWHKSYGGKGINYGRTCMQTTDGGFVFVGVSNAVDGFKNSILLIKTNAQGE